ADGALQVKLALDTVAGITVGPRTPLPGTTREINTMLFHYAHRLVDPHAIEKYHLAIVATEDEDLLRRLATMAPPGGEVLGIKGEQVASSTLLQDRLIDVLNADRAQKLTMEN